MWVAIHKGIEATLGISLYSYLYPKTNAVILLDMGHTLRGEHAWEK
jgi:hypothetical protein